MTECELVQKLGPPDKVALDENGSRDLMYFRQQLVLKVEPEGRLGWIEVHDGEARWDGVDPWALSRERLLALLTEKLGEAYEFDDYGSLETYTFSRNWVELQYELGRLTSFNLGVLYGEGDEKLYPARGM